MVFRNIFFALLPDVAARLSAVEAQAQAVERFQFTGKRIAPDRFHVSLHSLGTHPHLPAALVDAARQAADTVRFRPFRIRFSEALSFRRTSGDHAFVLRGDDADTPGALKSFHEHLGAALRRAGVGEYVNSRFTPHLTLLYDRMLIPEHLITPVSWLVTDFVLIESLIGRSTYRPLGRWTLRAE